MHSKKIDNIKNLFEFLIKTDFHPCAVRRTVYRIAQGELLLIIGLKSNYF